MIGFNFLYFITRNVMERYNRTTSHFKLGGKFFGEAIGFLRFNKEGKEIVYPPLYNKGAIGMKNDGTFVFGRVTMPEQGLVAISLGKEEFNFNWSRVNAANDLEAGISIYTPNEDKFKDPSYQANSSFGETRSMYFVPQSDNYNFVMVNDHLLGVVKGRTEIPPFGTVLSVPPAFLTIEQREFLDQEVEHAQAGPRVINDPSTVRFVFDIDQQWADTKWIMGGALLMVDNGKVENLKFDPAHPKDSVYGLEGWDKESSQRTQETPVETNLNEARTTVGLTEDGQFFISVIDGRANNRTGATHEQTVEWVQDYFRQKGTKIKYALDLDGASSVALGIYNQGVFYLLNQTARGSDSKLNDIRYYNHAAYLRKITKAQAPTGASAQAQVLAFADMCHWGKKPFNIYLE